MTAVEYILEGLEAELELERELGVRVIECDRALFADVTPLEHGGSGAAGVPGVSRDSIAASGSRTSGDSGASGDSRTSGDSRLSAAGSSAPFDFVFLHERPLSAKGVEMMAKIVLALGKTAEAAPIVIAPPIPEARAYVFLGAKALAKYQPDLRLAENCWGKSAKGRDILLVKSPEEIVRFATVTPALQKIKQEMWRSLKGLRQRFG